MGDTKRTDEIQGEIIHEYDGIEEADNQLPRWWLWTFYASVVFAIGYWFAYHEFTAGSSPTERYLAERLMRESQGGEISEEMLLAHAADRAMVEPGRELFISNCAPCHGAKAEGTIGPNLTDEHWLHGGAPLEIFESIRSGVPARGMPAWGQSLGPLAVQQLAAFVLTLRGQNVPGKPPEGERWVPAEDQAAIPQADTATPQVETAEPQADTATPQIETAEPHADTATPQADTATPQADTATPQVETAQVPPAEPSGT